MSKPRALATFREKNRPRWEITELRQPLSRLIQNKQEISIKLEMRGSRKKGQVKTINHLKSGARLINHHQTMQRGERKRYQKTCNRSTVSSLKVIYFSFSPKKFNGARA